MIAASTPDASENSSCVWSCRIRSITSCTRSLTRIPPPWVLSSPQPTRKVYPVVVDVSTLISAPRIQSTAACGTLVLMEQQQEQERMERMQKFEAALQRHGVAS